MKLLRHEIGLRFTPNLQSATSNSGEGAIEPTQLNRESSSKQLLFPSLPSFPTSSPLSNMSKLLPLLLGPLANRVSRQTLTATFGTLSLASNGSRVQVIFFAP